MRYIRNFNCCAMCVFESIIAEEDSLGLSFNARVYCCIRTAKISKRGKPELKA